MDEEVEGVDYFTTVINRHLPLPRPWQMKEVEGVDYFTTDLIRRTRARKLRLEKELGRQQHCSDEETATTVVFDENLGQAVRKSVADVTGTAEPAKTAIKSTHPSPTKAVLSANKALEISSPSIPFIDKSSGESSLNLTYSVSNSSTAISSTEELPRYKVEIPSRFSPVKKVVPSRKFSPALPSQSSPLIKQTSVSTSKASLQKPVLSTEASVSGNRKSVTPTRNSPSTKPILEKFQAMRAEATVDKQHPIEKSQPVSDVPISSIRGRIEKLEHVFAQQKQQLEPPSPAPEMLPMRHKKVLFERKIRQEAGAKMEDMKRNEYLAQKRGRSESKLPVVTEGLVARMQQQILAGKLSDGDDVGANFSSEIQADAVEAGNPANSGLAVAGQPSQESAEHQPNCVALAPDDFFKVNEESALAAFSEIEKMESRPLGCEVLPSFEPSIQYLADRRRDSQSDGVASMSMCTQSSQSDQEFDSLPSSPAKSSSSSNKIYPDLPAECETEALPSSPKKLRFCDDVFSAVECQPSSSAGTPLRTLSMYRIEQKQRLNNTPQIVPKVLSGKHKLNFSSNDQQEEIRKADLRRQLHLLKTEDIPRYEALTQQSIQALRLCLSSEFRDTESHADAERHVLVSQMKRIAAQHQIYSLNSQLNCPLPRESITGQLTVQRLDVPIMRDVILAHKKGLNSKSPENQYYFCVVSSGPIVHSTECLPFSSGYSTGFLTFNLQSGFIFSNLRQNFEVRIDVYEVAFTGPAKKETSRGIRLTPKKHPNPHPVADQNQDPRAQLKGTVNISMKNLKKKELDLQNFRFESTLQGSVRVGLSVSPNYQCDYSNFLNFYDDKVDIGTWKRRWCHLKGPIIQYWRLPEDEESGRKPIGEIDMRHCINPCIKPAPWDVCPRKESFVLVFAGTAADKTRLRVNWLVNKNYKDVIERNLVAADVVEERDEWISMLNEVVVGMRLWDEESLIPCSPAEIDSYIDS